MNKFIELVTSIQFLKRTISALVLAPIVIVSVLMGDEIFSVLLTIIAVLMSVEWVRVINSNTDFRLSKLARFGWMSLGFFYVMAPMTSLLYLRSLPYGAQIVLWLMLSVWATDIGAYIVGVSVGGPKIAPKISPTKSWSGLLGGVLSAILTGAAFQTYFENDPLPFVALSGLIAVISQIGDFLESGLKRRFKLKDSGNLIPGHGGILDRVDGLVTAAVFVCAWEILVRG